MIIIIIMQIWCVGHRGDSRGARTYLLGALMPSTRWSKACRDGVAVDADEAWTRDTRSANAHGTYGWRADDSGGWTEHTISPAMDWDQPELSVSEAQWQPPAVILLLRCPDRCRSRMKRGRNRERGEEEKTRLKSGGRSWCENGAKRWALVGDSYGQ